MNPVRCISSLILFASITVPFVCAQEDPAAVSSSEAVVVPGASQASDQLKAEIVYAIEFIQDAHAPDCAYQLTDTRFHSIDNDGGINEDWVVTSCGKEIIYQVVLFTGDDGKEYYNIRTPTKEERQ